MRVKLTDEKRFYKETKRIRGALRDYVRTKFSRKQYNTIMEKIKAPLDQRRSELAEKYKNKLKHLVAEREIEKREKLSIVPSGLEKYANCDIFNVEKMNNKKPLF